MFPTPEQAKIGGNRFAPAKPKKRFAILNKFYAEGLTWFFRKEFFVPGFH